MGAGSKRSSKKKAGIGARLLVMVFGAAMIALGSYPIQREFGSVWNFVKLKASPYAESIPRISTAHLREKNPKRYDYEQEIGSISLKDSWLGRQFAGLKDIKNNRGNSRARLASPKAKSSKVESQAKPAKPQVDHISRKDRAELDSLIEQLP